VQLSTALFEDRSTILRPLQEGVIGENGKEKNLAVVEGAIFSGTPDPFHHLSQCLSCPEFFSRRLGVAA
jgi:hypothetical protein